MSRLTMVLLVDDLKYPNTDMDINLLEHIILFMMISKVF
jgi:hypothetical protein